MEQRPFKLYLDSLNNDETLSVSGFRSTAPPALVSLRQTRPSWDR